MTRCRYKSILSQVILSRSSLIKEVLKPERRACASGVYLGAGPNDERRVMLVVMGVDLNGDKDCKEESCVR